jgi:hypothetical protein
MHRPVVIEERQQVEMIACRGQDVRLQLPLLKYIALVHRKWIGRIGGKPG